MVDIADSSKSITSPIEKPLEDNTDTSISVADVLPTICPTAPVSAPIIFSPKIDAVSKDNPDGKVNLSNVGELALRDS